MAMKLGFKTKFLIINTETTTFDLSNSDYTAGFNPTTGAWTGTATMTEDRYLDLGIVTDEREEFVGGGIAITLPGTGVQNRYNWMIGGKILRLTITGIIPDGEYVGVGGDSLATLLDGKSNASVFRYKLNKYFGYTGLFSTGNLNPNKVQYRRTYLYEQYGGAYTDLAFFAVTGYSFGFIEGTRNVAYTLTLDLANNETNTLNNDSTGIRPRSFGEVR